MLRIRGCIDTIVAWEGRLGQGSRKMHHSGVRHALRLGVVLAFVALAVGACGTPEEAKPRPLPEDTRELDPGTYRSEDFEPAFSFRVGEGWSTSPPEAYDFLLITCGNEGGDLGFANL